MNKRIRAALAAASAIATLSFASAALAANTGSVSVWHTPQTLANSQSTTIHVNVPQSTDPIAAVNIYSGTGYTLNASQAANTQIGTVEATAFSRDNNLTLPLSGTVVTSDATSAANKAGSAQCTGIPQSTAVWIMNLSVAGNTLAIPVYVNATAGPEQTLGGNKLSICLPPPDVPVGTPGRAFQGAQLLDAKLTLANVFTTPNAGGLIKWETLFTPYNPGIGTINRAGTFETRAFVPLPIILGISVKYKNKKLRTYTVSGKAMEGGAPVSGLTLSVLRGLTAKKLAKVGSAKTRATGGYSIGGKLAKRATTFFQVSGSVGERDYTSTGCASPLTPFAPAGCVHATLSPWSVKSVLVKLNK
jgi:hypothetical protein